MKPTLNVPILPQIVSRRQCLHGNNRHNPDVPSSLPPSHDKCLQSKCCLKTTAHVSYSAALQSGQSAVCDVATKPDRLTSISYYWPSSLRMLNMHYPLSTANQSQIIIIEQSSFHLYHTHLQSWLGVYPPVLPAQIAKSERPFHAPA